MVADARTVDKAEATTNVPLAITSAKIMREYFFNFCVMEEE